MPHNRTELEMAGAQAPNTERVDPTKYDSYQAMESAQLRKSLPAYKYAASGDGGDGIMGKNYKDYTSADFSTVVERNNHLVTFPLLAFSIGAYDIINEIKPTAMSRAEYFSVLLREARRLGRLEAVLNNSGFLTNTEASTLIQVTRPLDAEPGKAVTATIAAGDAIYRDLATNLLVNKNARETTYGMDIAKQLGFTAQMDATNPVVAVMIGYAAASNPYLAKQGSLPLSLNFKDATIANQRTAFCSSMEAVVNPGRPTGLDQNMSISTGALLAREQAKTAFADTGKKIRLHGEACPATPLPWNAATMGAQLTSEEVGRKSSAVATR